jgi:hypothetical protein
VIRLMRAIAIPNGTRAVGYSAADREPLVASTLPQHRLLGNAPCEMSAATLGTLFDGAASYW